MNAKQEFLKFKHEVKCAEISVNIPNTLLGCVFCHGTGMVTFVDMSKVPNYTSMVIGDETWKKYEEVGACSEGCQILN